MHPSGGDNHEHFNFYFVANFSQVTKSDIIYLHNFPKLFFPSKQHSEKYTILKLLGLVRHSKVRYIKKKKHQNTDDLISSVFFFY